jgi:tape measure domain-containing protein
MSAGTTARVVFKGRDLLSREMNRISKSSRRMARQFRTSMSSMKKSFLEFKAITSGFRLGSLGILGGLLSIGGAFSFAKEAVLTAARIEGVEAAITHLSGSAEEGQRNIKFLRDLTLEMGLNYDVAAEGYKRFSASIVKGTYTFDEQRKMYREMSIGIRTLGLDAQQQERIFYALSEMLSKTTVMSQELKLQLAQALPGSPGLMAEAFGTDIAGLFDAMQTGGVDTYKVLHLFTELIQRDYIGGLEAAKQTTDYNLSWMSAKWTFAMVDIGKAISKGGAVKYLGEIVEEIANWVELNKELITDYVKRFVETIKEGVIWIRDNKDQILAFAKDLLYLFVGLKVVMMSISLATLLANPIALAVTSAVLLLGAFRMIDMKSSDIREGLVKNNKQLKFMIEQGLAFQNITADSSEGVSLMAKRWYGVSMAVWSAVKSVISFLKWATGSKEEKSMYQGAIDSIDKTILNLDRKANPEIYKLLDLQKKEENEKQRARLRLSGMDSRSFDLGLIPSYLQGSRSMLEVNNEKKKEVHVKVSMPAGLNAEIENATKDVFAEVDNYVPSFVKTY